MTEVPTVTLDAVPDPLPEQLPVIDVREQHEWDAGHIEGARHLPLSQPVERLGEVPEGQVLVVCKVGGRSAQAVAYLAQLGHDVVNLEGGMLEWEAAERPMVSADGQPPRVV